MPLFKYSKTGETCSIKEANEYLSSGEHDAFIEYRDAMRLGYMVHNLIPSKLRTRFWIVPTEEEHDDNDPVYLIGRYRTKSKRFELLYRARPKQAGGTDVATYAVVSFESDGRKILNRKTKWFRNPTFIHQPKPGRGIVGALSEMFSADVDYRPALDAAVAQM